MAIRSAENQQIEAVARIAEELEDLGEQCAEGFLRIDELKERLEITEKALANLLPEGSTAFRVFDRGRGEIDRWWEITSTGYVERSHCAKLAAWRALVEKVYERLSPVAFASQGAGRKQYFLEAGDLYRAAKILLRILRRANRELLIVDPYLDGTVFEYLDEIDSPVEAKLITANKKPVFVRLLQHRSNTKACPASARECAESHDRFILIDGNELWHFGASINSLGKQAAMVNLVVEGEQKQSALASIHQWWKQGVKL